MKPLFLNSISRSEISAGLGDQGSQVRVLSPRFAAHCTAVKPFSADCSGFQLPGISHFAGTSTHSLIDVLSCKTTLSRGPRKADPVVGTLPFRAAMVGEPRPGRARRSYGNFSRRPGRDDPPALRSRSRSEVDQVVTRAEKVQVVVDDHDRRAGIHEAVKVATGHI